jgi:hypothetical protein
LTSDQLETLRGTSTNSPSYAGSLYLSCNPNANVYTCRVNQVSWTASFAQITYDGGSGTLADVMVGMTVLISHTNDRSKAFFRGRVRKTPGVATLYINETSSPIANDDYVFIILDFAIHDKLGRMVSGVLKMDYDVDFRQLLPVTYNIKTVYADWVDIVSEEYEIEFEPLAVAATSGATISSWLWDVGDGTITVGTDSDQNITATFPEGHRYIHLTVTDSGGRSITRHIEVFAHGDTYQPELINAGSLQVTATVATGIDATVTAFAGVDTILDNTLIVAWSSDEIYQDFEGSLVGDNIAFVGRLRKHTDTTRTEEQSAIDTERQYTIEGALTQLARIEQLPYEMLNDTTPTAFGQINMMTLWRGIVYLLAECSTFLELHSLYFDDTTNAYLAPTRNPVGNILNAINDLAGSINSALQINYAGQAEIVLDLRMGTTAQRTAAVAVADLDSQDILDIQLDHSHVRTVGRLKASGGAYNSVSNLYATYESLAPGVAQDYPEGTGSLDKQVLTANAVGAVAQLELNVRAGHAFERAQEVDNLTVLLPDGYHSVLIPALNQWYTFTISDTEINIELDTTTRWLLTEVNTTHSSADGTKEVRAIFTKETSGAPGQTVVYPVVAETPLLEPTFPPFDPYPTFPIDIGDIIGTEPVIVPIVTDDQIPTNGNAVITWTTLQLLIVVNALLTLTPGTRDVTPADMIGTIRDGKLGAGKDFYLLVSDGETSWVYYTEDIFAGEPVWVATEIIGLYTELETTATQGEVYIYGQSGACEDLVITFDSMDDADYTIEQGSISSGNGYLGTDALTGEIIGGDIFQMRIHIPVDPGCIIASVYFRYKASNTRPIQDIGIEASYYDADDVLVRNEGSASLPGAADNTWRDFSDMPPGGATDVSYIELLINWGGASSFGTDAVMDEITIGISGGVGGDGETRYSDDYAVTFATAEAVGTVPGLFIGIATSKIGSQILVAADGQTQKASAGGAYAAYGIAHTQGAYFIPRYIFTSSSSGNTGTTPEYLLFAPELDTGESMWRVTAGGNTFFDVTPIRTSVEGLAVGHRCIAMFWRSGSKIVGIAEFAGTVRRLFCSDDSGASFTFSGVLHEDACALTTRKSDANSRQVFLTNGTELGICADAFAATPLISNRNIGLSDSLIGLQVYG